MKKTELLEIAKPILFNTEMVKAILEGRKTVTRRVMKPQPLFFTGRKYIFADETCPKKLEDCDNILEAYRYQVGDILCVRETWCKNGTQYLYKAGCPHLQDNMYVKWRPSIHMPKEAARIFLKVTDVSVERLQDITEEQAMNEGVPCTYWSPTFNDPDSGGHDPDFVEAFEELWNSTIKKKDLDEYGWGANPWVWVIEFEKLEVE